MYPSVLRHHVVTKKSMTAINHIISEYCKLAQKEYETIHDWVEKKIHWELCKK